MKTLALTLLVAGSVSPGFSQISWNNLSPANVTDDIASVVYANNTFAAVTDQGNLLTSGDGLTWASRPIAPGLRPSSIAYGAGVWVIVGAGGKIYDSPDLALWTPALSSTTNTLNYVAYLPGGSGGAFIAVGDGGTIAISLDGQYWIPKASGVTVSLYGASAFTPFLDAEVCGQNGTVVSGQWLLDSTTFTPAPSGIHQDLFATYAQIFGATVDLKVGAMGTISNDGLAASISGPAETTTLRAVTYGAGIFVTVGDQGTILTSADAKAWAQRFPGDSYATLSTANLRSAAFSEDLQRFVAVGARGTILVSNASPTVFANVSTRGVVGNNQPLIGGFVVEGSQPRTVLIRADGPVLSQFGVAYPLPDPSFMVYDSKGNVVSGNAGWTTGSSAASLPSASSRVGAFALPNPSMDSAVLVSLNPGAYTVVISSAGGNSGTALFEAYIY